MSRLLAHQTGKKSDFRFSTVIPAIGLALALMPEAALANGFGENAHWQFRTDEEFIAQLTALGLREREQNGSFGPGDTIYNIAGDMINCNVTSSAAGNTSSATQDGRSIGNEVSDGGSIAADSAGNGNSGEQQGGTFSGSNSFGDLETGSTSTLDGFSDAGAQTITTTQDNDGDQTAEVNDSGISNSLDGGTGGNTSPVLNSTQGLTDSPVTAAINDSQACSFTQIEGNRDSMIVHDVSSTSTNSTTGSVDGGLNSGDNQ
ncbi:hypothetical protein [Frigidibacter sp. SD6-1]|uniref:hypothetical protein n=1 Tax=Frigidibacter sp. SD6-1 TaxID=3032581 RepID=UPI0024E03291|nr:hypothetical protein [Frigidibacter sp. SD6-1]